MKLISLKFFFFLRNLKHFFFQIYIVVDEMVECKSSQLLNTQTSVYTHQTAPSESWERAKK